MPTPGPGPDLQPRWQAAFDTSSTGDLSGVWGSGPNDVFVVGGTPEQGEVYHFDGQTWRQMPVPDVPLLVWVYGFGPDDVIAVGEDGGAIHYDGTEWTALDTGVDEALWGVWGASPDNIWIVGGDVGVSDPVILHYDGKTFERFAVPNTDRNATALFKVWGIGSKVFAVGERGLILEFDGSSWQQVPAGPDADDDFVSLWGNSENNIVAVGGRGSARIAEYDGTAWSTLRFDAIPGLNAVYMTEEGETVVGGVNGFAGLYDMTTNGLIEESTDTLIALHSTWGDENGRYYSVGGRFSPPPMGVALVRTIEEVSSMPPEVEPQCMVDDDCASPRICSHGTCVRPDSSQASFTLGYMESDTFIPIADGEAMPLHRGFQGLSHIFTSTEVAGIAPVKRPRLRWIVTSEDGVELADFEAVTLLEETDDPDTLRIVDQFIAFSNIAEQLDGQRVNIHLRLKDGDTDEVIVELEQAIRLELVSS